MGAVLFVLVLMAILIGKDGAKKVMPEVKVVEQSVPGNFKNNYMAFKYLPEYTLEDVPTTDGRVMVNVKLTKPNSVILLNLRGASQELGEISEVQMRRANTFQYSEEVGIKGEARGLLFRTADRKERTVFFKKGARLLTVTLTANSADPTWDKEFQDLIDSVEW